MGLCQQRHEGSREVESVQVGGAKKLAAAASTVSAPEWDVLPGTMRRVPGSRPDFVPRPRLAERLDEAWGKG